MNNRHKVFISYHHDEDKPSYWNEKRDFEFREEFEKLFSDHYDILVLKSVQNGDISPHSSSENTHRIIRDEYLRDSTVTVVLIGNDTWKRKHVDWELSSSLRKTSFNSRLGLIGILLPSFTNKEQSPWSTYGKISIENSNHCVDKNYIPERLAMNIDNGFAKIYDWSNSPNEIQKWIHEAFERRDRINPDNTLQMFEYNK